MKIIEFESSWCTPCDAQHEIMEDLEEFLGVDVEYIDVEENQDIANAYGVRGIPFIVLEEDGEVLESFQGLTQADTIAEAVNRNS